MNGADFARCHPRYMGAREHVKLSKPGAFDGLRIHTDEIMEVISRITPSTLTIAIVSIQPSSGSFGVNTIQLMDSMDWFDPDSPAALSQVLALNKVLKMGGRVLFRSAAKEPWYASLFQQNGFDAKCVARRESGTCIDR
jgi:betaine lipid synthase